VSRSLYLSASIFGGAFLNADVRNAASYAVHVFVAGAVCSPMRRRGCNQRDSATKKESDTNKANRDKRWRLEAQRLLALHDTLALQTN